jgi:hypothetical protein
MVILLWQRVIDCERSVSSRAGMRPESASERLHEFPKHFNEATEELSQASNQYIDAMTKRVR